MFLSARGSVAADEVERRFGAPRRMGGRDVIGITRQHQQARIRDLLLPGAGLVDRGQPAALGCDEERGTVYPWQVAPDVSAGDRLHKADLRRDRSAAHEFDPPFDALGWKFAAETTRHCGGPSARPLWFRIRRR